MQSQHMTDVWNIFDRGKPFPWSFRGQRQKKLIDILKRQHPAEAKKVKELIDDDHAKINKELRCIVSPILGQGNEELKLELSSWVIKDWGGIRRLNTDIIKQWLNSLSDFDDKRICEFIKKNGNNRISSWSKLLSFFDPEKYAIYDSRTAFALNFALSELKDNWRFIIPASQNKSLRRSIPNYQYSKDAHIKLGYCDYLEILRASPYDDILSAEMVLFSNAPELVKK